MLIIKQDIEANFLSPHARVSRPFQKLETENDVNLYLLANKLLDSAVEMSDTI